MSACATQRDDSASLDQLFQAYGIDQATLVVEHTQNGFRRVYNESRSRERFTPASTFKIPNTLIGLSSGAISSDIVFSWDGTERAIDSWNADQSLESAFRVSCLWCYQEIARRVGATGYRDALSQIGYGNQSIGEEIDEFWIDGSLAISAAEQIGFLESLYRGDLPYTDQEFETLRRIMLAERTEDYSLYAKTGMGRDGSAWVAWYVGYVETADGPWLFAMNMRADDIQQAAIRQELTMSALRSLGVI